jgi:hypothetical protein
LNSLLVDLATLLLKLRDLLRRGLTEPLVFNEEKEVPVLHDLHLNLNALIFVFHNGMAPRPFSMTREPRFRSFGGIGRIRHDWQNLIAG